MLFPHEFVSFLKKTSKKLIPLYCLFELTYRCNLNCIHCYNPKNKKKEVTKKKAFEIIDQLEKAGCLFITFSGGEIFVRKDFFEIAKYARDKFFALRLFTNGTLINSKIADEIRDLKPMAVEISLYGFKTTHEKITQKKGSFDKTVEAIKLLKERDIEVFVKTVLMNLNIVEFWDLRNFIKEMGVRMRGVGGNPLIAPTYNGGRKPLSYRLRDTELKRYMREELEQMKIMGNAFTPKKGIPQDSPLCNAGIIKTNITPYLEVNPCVQISFKDNSLCNRTFIDIWKNNEDFLKLRNTHLKDRIECPKCEFVSYCFACPGISLLEEGSFVKPLKEACRTAKIKKEIHEKIFKG